MYLLFHKSNTNFQKNGVGGLDFQNERLCDEQSQQTSMHSPSMHCAGGVYSQGGCLARRGVSAQGVSTQEGVICPGGGSLPRRGVSAEGCLPLPPVNRMTDRCKALPCHNFIVGSNYKLDQGESLVPWNVTWMAP